MKKFIIIISLELLVVQFVYGVVFYIQVTYAVSDGTKSEYIYDGQSEYIFSSSVGVLSISPNSSDGSIIVIFYDPSEASMEKKRSKIYSQKPTEGTSDSFEIDEYLPIFEIDRYLPVKLYEGQLVKLKGTTYSFQLLGVTGSGCGSGQQC